MRFPVWPIRKFEETFIEGNYLCLSTYRNRYVVDYVDSDIEDYVERRLELLRDVYKPYPLYPIHRTISDTGELLLHSKSDRFYDGSRFVVWKKKKFYKVIHATISSLWSSDTGQPCCLVHKISQIIKLPRLKPIIDDKVSLVKYNGRYYFLEYGHNKERIKL